MGGGAEKPCVRLPWVRTGPNRSEQVRTSPKTSKNLRKLEKQIKKLEDEHGVMPGKQIPEIPPEQATISDVSDPEEDKDKLN